MAFHVAERVQKYRSNLRAAGLRPVQIWVPDTRLASFDEECRRQSRLVSEADRSDTGTLDLMDKALTDTDGWTA
jgi:hypothetical protein